MSEVLARWDRLSLDEAQDEIRPCCGSRAWSHQMAERRPIGDEAALLAMSDDIWAHLSESDWTEAFASHPRIGETRTEQPVHGRSAAWSTQEQENAIAAADIVKAALADANRDYEQKFGRIFIVCATGKTAPEILAILQRRLANDGKTELHEAAEQQRQITRLRLKKWLRS
jgi:2-oxo-4-hydroxy-4-carboxy-5-ureidoimidazoline decarboxylase